MQTHFGRTVRALVAEDESESRTWPLLTLVGLAAWLFWAGFVHVHLIETSDRARIELKLPPYPIVVPTTGRIRLAKLALNQHVNRGELLFEIDVSVEQRRLAEEAARSAGLQEQIAAALGELNARQNAHREEQRVAGLATLLSRARADEAEKKSAFAKTTADRFSMLRAHAPELDILRATSEAQQRQAEEAAQKLGAMQAVRERVLKRRYAHVELAEVHSELATLQGQLRVSLATIDTLRAEVERRRVVAPFGGQIGALSPLSEGTIVQAGSSFGVLLPTSQLRAVADYQPAAALGRVRVGQTAWMRLDGFPFTQYGRLRLRVARQANEVHDGHIRVELDIEDEQFPIVLSHGLPGNTDIEVESVTPLQLCIRAMGRMLTASPRTEHAGGRR